MAGNANFGYSAKNRTRTIHLHGGIGMGNARKRVRRVWGNGWCSIGTPGTTLAPTATVGLVAGQKLIVALLALGVVLVLLVGPLVRSINHTPTVDAHTAHRRLMKEIRHHGNID